MVATLERTREPLPASARKTTSSSVASSLVDVLVEAVAVPAPPAPVLVLEQVVLLDFLEVVVALQVVLVSSPVSPMRLV